MVQGILLPILLKSDIGCHPWDAVFISTQSVSVRVRKASTQARRSDKVPLRDQCVKLWEWSKRYRGNSRKLEIPGMWKLCQGKLQAVSRAMPSRSCVDCNEQGRKPWDCPRLWNSCTPDSEHQDTGFNDCFAGLHSYFVLIYYISLSFPFVIRMFTLCHLS